MVVHLYSVRSTGLGLFLEPVLARTHTKSTFNKVLLEILKPINSTFLLGLLSGFATHNIGISIHLCFLESPSLCPSSALLLGTFPHVLSVHSEVLLPKQTFCPMYSFLLVLVLHGNHFYPQEHH